MQSLFGTPVGAYQVPRAAEINPALCQAIRDREGSGSSNPKSNVGGWHSDMDVLAWPEVIATHVEDVFRNAVLEMVRHTAGMTKLKADLKIGAWANLNRGGAFHSPHNHPGHDWSGVYYVHVGDLGGDPESRDGFLVLHDPRGSINMIKHPGRNPFGSIVHIRPVEGQLILFPSWLLHSVTPFSSTAERITIAFNARIGAWDDGEEAPAAAGSKSIQ